MRFIVTFLAFTASTISVADAINQLEVIGFSKNGDYLAFESYGEGPSGDVTPVSTYYFIDVKQNIYAHDPINVLDRACAESKCRTVEMVRTEAAQKAAPILKKLGIQKSDHGVHVYTRLAGDLTEVGTLKLAMFGHPSDAKLLLSMSSQPTQASLPGGQTPQLLRLAMKHGTSPASAPWLPLQVDKELPAARKSVVGYRFKDVMIKTNTDGNAYVAVFLEIDTPGREGPDTRHMAITGKVSKL